MNLERLEKDGVDVTAVEVDPTYVTGSAFVRYRDDGDRDFVFNIKNSACGQLRLTDTGLELLRECSHLHVSGASLSSPRMVEMVTAALELVKSGGGSVSFDPNIRKEVLRDPEVRAALRGVLASCDTFLPSGEELTLLTRATTPQAAVAEILGMGVSAIVVKNGAQGATYFDANGSQSVPGYPVQEVDPTGAGDCFGATFITCRLQGRSVEESLDYANAGGARAVTIRGPMEGTSSFAELDALRSGGHVGRAAGLRALVAPHGKDGGAGSSAITSVCSAHPMVVEAALREAAAHGTAVLIEATCNQVNQEGGYTGMTPVAFRDQVHGIAEQVGFPREQIILGGDHLGPNPWRHLSAEHALARAEAMVAAYVAAGYEKIHIDTSMGLKGEPEHLPDAVTAERAVRLAMVAEATAARVATRPRYVIGTEVPVPGGAVTEIDHLEVTRPEAVAATLEAHKQAFGAAGAEAAFEAVIALVAQPGVEFDDRNVVVYEPERARELSAALDGMPGLVFEAHSTDYQPAKSLAGLVTDGFAILKVGPGLTFALREALYGLDQIAGVLDPELGRALAHDGDGNGDARQPRILAVALSGRSGRSTCAPAFQLQRPYPLLLGRPSIARGGPTALGPPDGNQYPGTADQPVSSDALSARGRWGPRPGAQDPGARSCPRRTSCLRLGVSRNGGSGTSVYLDERPAMNVPPPARCHLRTAKQVPPDSHRRCNEQPTDPETCHGQHDHWTIG